MTYRTTPECEAMRADREGFQRLYDRGWSFESMAAHYRVGIKTVQRRAREMKLPVRGYRRWTSDELEEMERLRGEGLEWSAVAVRMGRNISGWSCARRFSRISTPPKPKPRGLPSPTLAEDAMLDLIWADGGFPVLREVELKGNRFGVLLTHAVAVVATGVSFKVAA